MEDRRAVSPRQTRLRLRADAHKVFENIFNTMINLFLFLFLLVLHVCTITSSFLHHGSVFEKNLCHSLDSQAVH